MDRTIGFNEQELNNTLKLIDGLIRRLMEHNLPLIYEVLNDPKPNDIARSHAFACEILEDAVNTLARIELQLTNLDPQKCRISISLDKIKEQINKFEEDRTKDHY